MYKIEVVFTDILHALARLLFFGTNKGYLSFFFKFLHQNKIVKSIKFLPKILHCWLVTLKNILFCGLYSARSDKNLFVINDAGANQRIPPKIIRTFYVYVYSFTNTYFIAQLSQYYSFLFATNRNLTKFNKDLLFANPAILFHLQYVNRFPSI